MIDEGEGSENNMESNPPSASPEAAPTQELPQTVKESRKKLYSVLGVVAAAIVIAVVALALFAPTGLGQTIPYGFNYQPGERLTYNISISMSSSGQTVTEAGTAEIDVLGFDGENYSISESVGFTLNGIQQNNSFTLVINKHGQLVSSSNVSASVQQSFAMLGNSPGFGMFINRTEVREGENVQMPLNLSSAGVTMTGK